MKVQCQNKLLNTFLLNHQTCPRLFRSLTHEWEDPSQESFYFQIFKISMHRDILDAGRFRSGADSRISRADQYSEIAVASQGPPPCLFFLWESVVEATNSRHDYNNIIYSFTSYNSLLDADRLVSISGTNPELLRSAQGRKIYVLHHLQYN